jgi:hypothetical protein
VLALGCMDDEHDVKRVRNDILRMQAESTSITRT